MKMIGFAAAAMMAAAGLVPAAPAAAQHRVVVHERTVVRHGPAPRWGHRKVCSTEWRHHHRVRTCRTVRYRR